MRREQQAATLIIFNLVWILAGCGKQVPSSDSAGGSSASAPQAETAKLASSSGETKAVSNGTTRSRPSGTLSDNTPAPGSPNQPTFQLAALQVSQPDRYLIKNATISVEAKDVRGAANKITAAVAGVKGYSSDMHESVDGLGALSITLSVRIPFSSFAQSMSQIEMLGKVLDKQVTAEDVTEEYVDSDAKVRNFKRTEERLLTHLTKTGKLSDTLLIEKELNRVRQEIEQIEGRLRFLSNRISFSTIQITLKETARPQALVPPESYSAGHTFSDAARSVVDFGRGLLNLGIWLAVWAIFWLPIVLLAAWLLRNELRRRTKLAHGSAPIDPHPMA